MGVEDPAFVQFRGLSKSFDGRTRVVDGLDLDIARGEFVTLLGPSGSGKTTCLMMLAGFESPTEGEIRVAGQRIDGLPPHRRGIGVVFQNYALFPHMTVAGNLAFPLQVRGMARADCETRVTRVLERVRLVGLAERYPSQLSGGQQQRVAVARALVFEPTLVLMDEPLGALDKQLRESLQYEIKQIHRSFGVTVVYVTHDQSEALTMSDRVAVFRAGRLEQVADPRTVYEQPATSFAARFIGETNVLEGKVAGRTGPAEVLVEIGAGRPIRAMMGNIDGRLGEAARLCVRPEHVHLSHAGDNILAGTVADSIFHGDHVRLRVELVAGGEFILKLPPDRARADLGIGTPTQLSFAVEHCRALDVLP